MQSAGHKGVRWTARCVASRVETLSRALSQHRYEIPPSPHFSASVTRPSNLGTKLITTSESSFLSMRHSSTRSLPRYKHIHTGPPWPGLRLQAAEETQLRVDVLNSTRAAKRAGPSVAHCVTAAALPGRLRPPAISRRSRTAGGKEPAPKYADMFAVVPRLGVDWPRRRS